MDTKAVYMKNVVVLGATGSVGGSVLDVVRRHPGRFRVVGLAARSGGDKLAALAREFPDARLAVADKQTAGALRREIDGGAARLLAGCQAGVELVENVPADICVAAAAGTAGLGMAFAAARKGVRILLANKEVMVSAGRLFLETVRRHGAEVIPLDSEHSALFQCLDGRDPAAVDRLVVTASGGPFREWSRERLATATPADALKHPVWNMGRKISVDSASLANKALEVIEAHHLFGIPFDRIDVLVHPEALIHGMVEFIDGGIMAQLEWPDMRFPAQFALLYPERVKTELLRLKARDLRQLSFMDPDGERFPLLGLGVEAGKSGDRAAAAFNAANEAAVELFLEGKIAFTAMPSLITPVLAALGGGDFNDLAEIEAVHCEARERVRELALS